MSEMDIHKMVEEMAGLLRGMACQLEEAHEIDVAEAGEDGLIGAEEFGPMFSRWMIEQLWSSGFEAGYEAHRADAKSGKAQQYVHAPEPLSDRVQQRKAVKQQKTMFAEGEE